MNTTHRIAMVAGEPSGDLLAARLIAALRKKLPRARFFGIGGPKMVAEGFDAWWPAEKLAVVGYVEAVKRYWEISSIRRSLRARLLTNSEKPDLFIGVDAPDFNLDLEVKLRAQGIRTVHYVSPSIWAWRGKRVHKVAKAADRVLALFPMEPPLYEQAGVPVSYVGHPLADEIPLETDPREAREILRLPDQHTPIFAFLPGSRQSELEYMGGIFVKTAKLIHATLPDSMFLVPFVTRQTKIAFEMEIHRQDAGYLPWRLLFGHAVAAQSAADAVLVASGTATLEAALVKRPMVIVYKLSRLAYYLMKWRAYLPYVGLPNILAGWRVVPELLQSAATPEAITDALLTELKPERAEQLRRVFTRIHLTLRQDTAEKAAEAVLEVLRQA
ncbi:MAG: lipid-A-disaccharide synthase [Zoogloeaceae bacterium]|jgi:lipid-A-disaccharide synthase|nr:lipid-A-disaccharide synthase [Zoogloeaceae bacterium]